MDNCDLMDNTGFSVRKYSANPGSFIFLPALSHIGFFHKMGIMAKSSKGLGNVCWHNK